MRRYLLPFLMLALVGCAHHKYTGAVATTESSWDAAKRLSYESEDAKKKGEKIALAEEGMKVADRCKKEDPKNPGCYYWHAVNTGLYYQSKIAGYQDGLKEMIVDCKKVIDLDPTYWYGGAYKVMGVIYTEVPPSSLKKDAIVQDVDLALELINKALEIALDYPENYMALAGALLKKGDIKGAESAYLKAVALLPKWKDHPDYDGWRKELKKLSLRIKKQINDLQM